MAKANPSRPGKVCLLSSHPLVLAELRDLLASCPFRLQARRLELQIRFEAEDGDVLLYGVGTEPFRAAAVDWLRWLNAEGARKLREFIATKGGAR